MVIANVEFSVPLLIDNNLHGLLNRLFEGFVASVLNIISIIMIIRDRLTFLVVDDLLKLDLSVLPANLESGGSEL